MKNSVKYAIPIVALVLAIYKKNNDLGSKELIIPYPLDEFIEDGGFNVDVVAAICKKINCLPKWVKVAPDRDGIFAALAAGKFDMAVIVTSKTDNIDENVDESDPYLEVRRGILMRTDETSDYIDDFLYDMKNNGLRRLANVEKLVFDGSYSSLSYDSLDDAVKQLLDNYVDGVIIDSHRAMAYVNKNPHDLIFVWQRDNKFLTTSTEPDYSYRLVFKKGSYLKEEFNYGLKAINTDGKLDSLIIKWWPIAT